MERRRFARVELHKVVALSSDGEKYLEAQCIDLGEGGIGCISSQPVEQSTRIYLIVGIPEGEKVREIQTEGGVVWVERKDDKYEFGVAFDQLSEADASTLRSFVSGA